MKISRARWVRPVAFAAVALIAVGCASSQADGQGSDDTVVAKIGDKVITASELDQEVRKQDAKAFQAYYDARKRVLDTLITQRLVEAETDKRGVTETQLMGEITANVPQVTEAEVQAFYTQNQTQMGGRTLEQIGPQIVQHLTNQRRAQVMSDFIGNLKKEANVQILLDAPRSEVKIAANDPKKGAEGAPITLVEFSDFQ